MGCLQSQQATSEEVEMPETRTEDIHQVDRVKSMSFEERLEIGSYCYVDCDTVYGVIIDKIESGKYIIIDLFEKRQRFASKGSLSIIYDENIRDEVRKQHDQFLEKDLNRDNDDAITDNEYDKKEISRMDKDEEHRHLRNITQPSIIGNIMPTPISFQQSDNDYGAVVDTLR